MAAIAVDKQRYNRRNPQKVRAWRILHIAVDKGIVVPQPCEKCGSIKSEAHHDDYSKPFSVRWLCKRHKKKRRGLNGDNPRSKPHLFSGGNDNKYLIVIEHHPNAKGPIKRQSRERIADIPRWFRRVAIRGRNMRNQWLKFKAECPLV